MLPAMWELERKSETIHLGILTSTQITWLSRVNMSTNKRFNISIQNRIQIRQLDACFYILYNLVWIKYIPTRFLMPRIDDGISIYACYIGNSLVMQDYEECGLQTVEGLHLICKPAPFTCTWKFLVSAFTCLPTNTNKNLQKWIEQGMHNIVRELYNKVCKFVIMVMCSTH